MRLHIRNGRFVDPLSGIDAIKDVFVEDGRFAAIGAVPRRDRAHEPAALDQPAARIARDVAEALHARREP